jgi:ABC-type transport system substrate-binding protein
LTDAGWDFSKKLTYKVESESETAKAVAQLFQANLQQLGISMDINQMETGASTDLDYGAAAGDERPDFFAWSWWPDYNDAYNEIYPSFYSQSNQTAAGPNSTFYSDKRLDEILDTVAPGVPDDQYNTLLAEANSILTEKNPGGLYYGSVLWYTIMAKNIQGFQPNPIYINTYNLYDMYRTE